MTPLLRWLASAQPASDHLRRKIMALAEITDGALPPREFPELGAYETDDWPPLRALCPTQQGPDWIAQLLSALRPEHLVPDFASRPDAIALKAGLYLIHDFLDQSHNLAQLADKAGTNRTAAYWHGIMHRREGDFHNARYWLRRVGSHPIFENVGRAVAPYCSALGQSGSSPLPLIRLGVWAPLAFIDLCEQTGEDRHASPDSATKLVAALQRMQAIEMRALLEFTWAAARGEV